MNELIILHSGYDLAINDTIKIINNSNIDDIDKKIIIEKIMKRQKIYKSGDNIKFEGNIYKYYDKQNNIGYIIYDTIYDLKGTIIYINEGKYTEIEEKEIMFIKNNFKVAYQESFNDKDTIDLKYKEYLEKFVAE